MKVVRPSDVGLGIFCSCCLLTCGVLASQNNKYCYSNGAFLFIAHNLALSRIYSSWNTPMHVYLTRARISNPILFSSRIRSTPSQHFILFCIIHRCLSSIVLLTPRSTRPNTCMCFDYHVTGACFTAKVAAHRLVLPAHSREIPQLYKSSHQLHAYPSDPRRHRRLWHSKPAPSSPTLAH